MYVKLNEDWRIRTIKLNFVLDQYRLVLPKGQKGSGDLKWVEIGYYPTLYTALLGFSRHATLNSDANGLEDIKVLLQELTACIEAVKQELMEMKL